ncbi:DNA-binding protein [bacterium]|nr:DNA-binding protein [bacterium]MBU3955948.1 DNA-binding protein [bacterium]MBU4134414.1 DNA-binding protein [bacterium]
MIIKRLNHGADLCEEIKRVCMEGKIKSGWFNAVGALKKLSVGFYTQDKKTYGSIEFAGPCEITSCMGNISLTDGEIFVHAHINVSDEKGAVKGGHLLESEIFAAEACIFPSDEILERELDSVTGLKLWR